MNALRLIVSLMIINSFLLYSNCFNVDTTYPIIFNGEKGSHFGYTLALHKTNSEILALIGAPKSRSPIITPGTNPAGSLMKCSITNRRCSHLEIDKTVNSQSDNLVIDFKDNMGLGSSIDVEPKYPGRVVVCAPNWRNKGDVRYYPVNGACYVLNNNLDSSSTQKLLPIIHKDYQVISRPDAQYYRSGQSGFSAHFSQFSDRLLLGTPGYYNWIGTVVIYNTPTDSLVMATIPDVQEDFKKKTDLYFGYSISSGKYFSPDKELFVAGAPRDGDFKGRIYIFDVSKISEIYKSSRINVTVFQEGQQFGEYFGAAVLSVNTNNDRYTDLIVGAPFHSILNVKGYDHGMFYEFIGSETGFKQGSKCSGSSISESRFASSLADLQDINGDGISDIAVGAPYEDQIGAVYIYHGSKTGLNCDYAQKITAKDVKMAGPGFGFSISKGMDVDDNKYPDILIGAYQSASAVILRSKPVININRTLESNVNHIDTSMATCSPKNMGSGEPCLRIKFCLKYSGLNAPSRTEVSINLTVDEDLQSVNLQARAYFGMSTGGQPVFKENITMGLMVNSLFCASRDVYILWSKTTFADPIKFRMAYRINEKQTNLDFCKNCPILQKDLLNFIDLEVPFFFSCGAGIECKSDLIVSAKVQGHEGNSPLIIGIDNVFTLEITVLNIGDAAYGSTVKVSIPNILNIINQGKCRQLNFGQDSPTEEHILECPLLLLKKLETLEIKLDASKISNDNMLLIVDIEATSISQEINPVDNKHKFVLKFQSQYNLRISGIAHPSLAIYTDENENKIEFLHRYLVYSLRTPVQKVSIEISLPGYFSGLGHVFNITNIEVSGSAVCSSSSWGSVDFEYSDLGIPAALKTEENNARSPERNQEDNEFILDCDTTSCQTISCQAGPIDSDNTATIIVSGYVDGSLLKKHLKTPNIDTIYYVTKGDVYLLQSGIIDMSVGHNTKATTKMIKEGFKDLKVPLWIIIVSGVGGVTILVLIVGILFKVGFFLRSKKTEMEDIQQEDKLLDDEGRAN